MEGAEARLFRACSARANYLAQDRPDLQYAVKEIARRMARPTGKDWILLKRLARYLKRLHVAESRIVYSEESGQVIVSSGKAPHPKHKANFRLFKPRLPGPPGGLRAGSLPT